MEQHAQKMNLITMSLYLGLVIAIANTVFVFGPMQEMNPPLAFGAANSFPHPYPALPASQTSLGWNADLEVKPLTGGQREIILTMTDRKGRALSGLDFEISLHPMGQEKASLIPIMKEQPDGRYTAVIEIPGAGEWEMRVKVRKASQVMKFTRPFTVKD